VLTKTPCRYEAVFSAQAINQPTDGDVEILAEPTSGVRMAIVACPDALLRVGDRGAALATVMLKKMFQGIQGEIDELLDAEIAAIASRRRKTAGSSAFVVITVDSEIDVDLDQEGVAHADFRVFNDLIDKEPIRQRARKVVDRALAALLLATDMEPRCDRLGEHVFLLPREGGVVYSISFTARAGAVVSRQIRAEDAERVRGLFAAISKGPDLVSVLSLLRAATDGSTEPLRRFLCAWSAIEIFTNKTFPDSERRWIAEATKDRGPLEAAHVRRISDVMKDKWRLMDKFALNATMLDAPGAETDVGTFKSMKDLRDQLLHGGVQDTSRLPADTVIALTRKQLRLHFGGDAGT
jgi:hypothetical protein